MSFIQEIMDEAKMNANKEAKKIIVKSIQRVASETIFDNIRMITQYENHLLNLNAIHASNLTKDCLKRLLQANPNDRVSAEGNKTFNLLSECLKHPWFYNEE